MFGVFFEPKPSWELNVAREQTLKIDYETKDLPKTISNQRFTIHCDAIRQSSVKLSWGKSILSWLFTLIPDKYFHLGSLSAYFIVTVSKLSK